MANTLASGASARKGLEVRLLSWASINDGRGNKSRVRFVFQLPQQNFSYESMASASTPKHRRLVDRLQCTVSTSHSMIAPIGGPEQTKSGTFECNMLRSAARRTLGVANWHALLNHMILQILCQRLANVKF